MTLPTQSPAVRLTDRDLDILAALNFGPLTARQLLKLSRTFATPFTDERRVRERLFALAAAGRVPRWLYATAGPGAPAYYTMTRMGHRLLHGADAAPPRRHALQPIGVAQQYHAHALAEFIVHTLVAVHTSGADVCSLARENDLRLTSGGEDLVPDAAFLIRLHGFVVRAEYAGKIGASAREVNHPGVSEGDRIAVVPEAGAVRAAPNRCQTRAGVPAPRVDAMNSLACFASDITAPRSSASKFLVYFRSPFAPL